MQLQMANYRSPHYNTAHMVSKMTRTMRRKHLVALLLWMVIWGVFFATLLFGIERLPNSDLSGQFHAFGIFQASELTSGRLPVWSPGSYGGVPFTADMQAALFYPPRWLTILFTKPFGFSFYALQMEGLLHIFLAGVFVYFLAFEITYGRSRSLRNTARDREAAAGGLLPEQWAGLIAAVAFALGGYLTSYPLLQLAILESIAWLPLILLLLRRALLPSGLPTGYQKSPVPALMIAGVVLGISATAGHPQTFLHIAYLAAIYYFFLTWQGRQRWSWALALGAVVGLVAVGTALAAFLPAAHFLPLTVRSDVSYDFVAKGFPLLDYIQLLVPGPLSFWLPQYSGLVTILLVVFAWCGRNQWPQRSQRSETRFWFVIVIVAAWLSLGDKGVLYELVYRVMPGFSLFRQQERLVGLVALGLALLAAQGLIVWLKADPALRKAWLRTASLGISAALLLVGLVLLMTQMATGRLDWVLLWSRQWFYFAAALLILRPGSVPTARRDQWRSLALLVLLCLDLFLPVRQAMDLKREPPSVFWPQPAWLQPLQEAGVSRVDSQNLFHANIGEIYGLEDVKGISPLKPMLTRHFEELPRPLRWQLLNVEHVLAEEPLEQGLTEIAPITESLIPGEQARGFVYRFEKALPRAWMVYEAINARSDDEALDLLKQPDFDPVQQVVVTNPALKDIGVGAAPAEPPVVEIERLSASELSIVVNTGGSPGFLVISEWALPGWKAAIDGLEAELLTANYGLQTLYVPAGHHAIALTYVARDVQVGILIALGTILAAALLAWRWQPTVTRRSEPARRTPSAPAPEWPNPHARLSPAAARWSMVGIVLLAFALRLFLLGNQELRGDEAFSYLSTLLPLGDVVPSLISQGDPHSPLHYVLLNVWVDLAGDSEFAMRWISLVAGLLLVPLLYQLGREMASGKAGLLAAMLAAISPSLIWLSQDVRNQYTLAIFFTALATWLLVRIAKPSSPRAAGRRVAGWVLYALVAALAVYSHYYAVFTLLSHGLYLWFTPGRRRLLGQWVAAGGTAGLLFLPWAMVVLKELLEAGQLSDPDSPELAHYLTIAGKELLVGGMLEGAWIRWLVLGLTLIVLAGFFALWRGRRAWAAMLLGWLGSALLGIYLVRFSRSTFNDFYVSVAAPAWILLLTAGLGNWWSKGGKWRGVGGVCLIALLLASSASLSNYYFDSEHSRTLGFRDVAQTLQAHARPGDLFIAHFPDPVLDYYLRDITLPRRMFPARNDLGTIEVQQALAQAAKEYDRLWIVPYHHSVWDPEDVVPGWLDRETIREQDLPQRRLTLQAYLPLDSAAPAIMPVEESLSDELSLDGVSVTANGRPLGMSRPPVLSSGTAVRVNLIWSPIAGATRSYTAFVHLLDDNGTLLAQHDGIPANGMRPATTWQAGEQIVDTHEFTVPEGVTGNGRLVIGLYDTETLERQLLANGQDYLLMLEVEFE